MRWSSVVETPTSGSDSGYPRIQDSYSCPFRLPADRGASPTRTRCRGNAAAPSREATVSPNSSPWMSAILENAPDLRSREAEVDRHEDGADLGRGKQGFHEFGAVMEQRGDAVALPDAGAREGTGEPAGARIQLSVGEPQVVERHRRVARVTLGAQRQVRANRAHPFLLGRLNNAPRFGHGHHASTVTEPSRRSCRRRHTRRRSRGWGEMTRGISPGPSSRSTGGGPNSGKALDGGTGAT